MSGNKKGSSRMLEMRKKILGSSQNVGETGGLSTLDN